MPPRELLPRKAGVSGQIWVLNLDGRLMYGSSISTAVVILDPFPFFFKRQKPQIFDSLEIIGSIGKYWVKTLFKYIERKRAFLICGAENIVAS